PDRRPAVLRCADPGRRRVAAGVLRLAADGGGGAGRTVADLAHLADRVAPLGALARARQPAGHRRADHGATRAWRVSRGKIAWRPDARAQVISQTIVLHREYCSAAHLR